MKIYLHEVASGNPVEALIVEAKKSHAPLKKDGWQFNWRKLFQTEGALFYKVVFVHSPQQIQGMLILTLLNNEMLFMNNIEVAPHNYGAKGQYDYVAGCLLAYACLKSFELGRNHYTGFLAFESKTELITLYQEKYGTTYALGHKMFFTPEAGKN